MNINIKLLTVIMLFITLVLAGCGGNNNNGNGKTVDNTKVEKTSNIQTQNNISNKETERWLKLAKSYGIESPDIEKFKKAYDIFVACQKGYCKKEYDSIKHDKIILDYFKRITAQDKIPDNAINYESHEDVVKSAIKGGFDSLSKCLVYYKRGGYKNQRECIIENAKKFKNLTTKQKKEIIEYVKISGKYPTIDYNDYLNVKNTCSWWKNRGFKTGEDLEKDLEKEREEGLNVVNFLEDTYEQMKDKFTKEEYIKIMKDVCDYRRPPIRPNGGKFGTGALR